MVPNFTELAMSDLRLEFWIAAIGIAAIGIGAPAIGVAQPSWDLHKGDCESVFERWRTESVDSLRNCLMNWEMYRDVSWVDADQRTLVHEAFDKLYQRGDRRDAVIAMSALKKLGLRPKSLRPETRALPKAAVETRVQVVRTEIDDGYEAPPSDEMFESLEPADADRPPDPRAAKRHTREGKSLFRQRRFSEGLSEFLIGADEDPTYADPLYGAATCYVRLDQPALAIDALRKMKAINSERARQLLHGATRDENLAPLRRMDTFKDLTGTAVIQLLNGGGDAGLEQVLKYKSRLDEIGMPVASVANDRNPRRNEYLYTKPGFEQQGEIIRRQLKLGMVHKRTIDWPSPYDIIVIHGVAQKARWVDDEAEKSGQDEAKKKKKAEEDAKRKKEEAEVAKKEELKRRMEMMKMLEQMDAQEAAGQVPGAPEIPTASDPIP